MGITLVIFYILPVLLLVDLIQITYKSTIETIYLWELITYLCISFCPVINLIFAYFYLMVLFKKDDEGVHDSFVKDFKKYSIFKFLFIKLN